MIVNFRGFSYDDSIKKKIIDLEILYDQTFCTNPVIIFYLVYMYKHYSYKYSVCKIILYKLAHFYLIITKN